MRLRTTAVILFLGVGLASSLNQAKGQTPTTQTVVVKVKESKPKDPKSKDSEPQNGEIPGATVTASNVGTGETKNCNPENTNLDGECKFQLAFGRYNFESKRTGFKTTKLQSVPVSPETHRVEIAMTQGKDTEVVSIEFSAPVQTQTAEVFAAPGADANRIMSFDGTTSSTSVVRGLSFDGVDLTTDLSGQTHPVLGGADSIEVWTVLTLPGKSGAHEQSSLSIITKSGTNDFHGKVSYRVQQESFAARHHFFLPQFDTFRWHSFGASAGGPIKKEKAFFFAGYEGNRYASAPTYSPSLVENLAALNSKFLQLGLPEQILESVLPSDASNNFLARIDFQPSKEVHLAVRYMLIQDKQELQGAGNITTPSGTFNSRSHSQSFYASITAAASNSKWTNELRFQFLPGLWRTRPSFPGLVNILVPQVVNFGRPPGLVELETLRSAELNDVLSLIRGKHVWQFGARFEHRRGDYELPAFQAGQAIIPSVQDFLLSPPRAVLFELGEGSKGVDVRSSYFAFFTKDTWKLSRRLSANFGIRYDLELPPELSERDTKNFGPSAGLAWDIFGSSKSVLRAGFGVSYNRLPLSAFGQALVIGGIGLRTVGPQPVRQVLSVVGSAAPAALSQFLTSGQVPVAPQLALPVSNEFRNAYTQTANLGIQQRLPRTRDLTLQVGYTYTRGVGLPLRANINLFPPILQPNGVLDFAYRFRDPRFAQINEAEAEGNSFFHAVRIGVLKSYSARFQLEAHYQFSKSIDETDELGQAQNSQDRRADRALSSQHAAHDFGGSFVIDLPWKLKFSFLGEASSAQYFNVVLGDDLNHDGVPLTDRPVGVSRNTFKGPGHTIVDLSLRRRFNFTEKSGLEVAVDVLNVFNATNFLDVNTVVGSPNVVLTDPRVAFGSRFLKTDFRNPLLPGTDFGLATQAMEPRRLQIGIKLDF